MKAKAGDKLGKPNLTYHRLLHRTVLLSVVVLAAGVSCGKSTPGTKNPSPDGSGDGAGGGAIGSGGASGSGGTPATGGTTGSGGALGADSGVTDSGVTDSGAPDSGADATTGFACGSATCDPTKEYCEHAPGLRGAASRDLCVPIPERCGSRATCSCVYTSCATGCSEPNGNVTLVTPCAQPMAN
jgi:hypothetical protein